MKLAECRARELAYRDEGRPRNEVCPRSGPVTHQSRRPTTMANIPELDSEVCPRSGPVTHQPRRPTTGANTPELDNKVCPRSGSGGPPHAVTHDHGRHSRVGGGQS